MPISGNENNFWTKAPSKDPKRSFRWKVNIGGQTIWYARKAEKPKFTLTESSHDFLMHKFYWPGKAEWNDVELVLVDPVEPDLAGNLVQIIAEAGYKIPAGVASAYTSISKASALAATGGDIVIQQIDSEDNVIEQWVLKHAWIREVTFGDLDYTSEDLTEVTMRIRYDWAEFSNPAAGTNDIFRPS
jgi:hypothetical protein